MEDCNIPNEKKETKKCDNQYCDIIIVKGEGKKYNSMSYNDRDIKVIELCDKCAKELES